MLAQHLTLLGSPFRTTSPADWIAVLKDWPPSFKEYAMTQILADAELAKQIAEASGPIQIVNESGTMLAVCMPSQTRSRPYTPEELEIRRKQVAETRAEFRAHPERFKTLRQIMEKLNGLAGRGS